jgi:hypothetical protein
VLEGGGGHDTYVFDLADGDGTSDRIDDRGSGNVLELRDSTDGDGLDFDEVTFRDNGNGTWTAAFPDGGGSITFDPSVVTEINLVDGLGDPGGVLRYNARADTYEVIEGDAGEIVFL